MKHSRIQSKMQTALTAPAFAVAMLGQIPSTQAQYSAPPTWMPMTMLNVSYDAGAQKLDVVNPSIVPVLSLAPAGTYDPAQPWGVLNGTAFGRRFGWYDPNSTKTDGTAVLDQIHAAYGSGASLWIQSQSQSPGLQTYLAVGKYGVNANNTTTVDPTANGYSGIFGTAGSSTQWQWDGMMDHNAYAVSLSDITAPNEMFTATYKLYVGDSVGNEILNPGGSSPSSLETWTWQAPATVPEPSTLSLAVLGLIGVWACRKIKSAQS